MSDQNRSAAHQFAGQAGDSGAAVRVPLGGLSRGRRWERGAVLWNSSDLKELTQFVWISGALALSIFLLISLGGLVRNAGAGLSCPDWPLCFGKVVPPMNIQVFLEWFHRLIAGFVSVGLLGLTLQSFLRVNFRRHFFPYLVLGVALIGVQVVLGGMTVLGLLSPKWVTSHLFVGLNFFSLMLWVHLRARRLRRELLGKSAFDGPLYGSYSQATSSPYSPTSFGGQPWSPRFWAGISWLAILVQVVLGGLVSSQYAGLACPDFPTCQGSWIPPLDGLVAFQFAHRLGALTVTVAIVGLLLACWKHVSRLRVWGLVVGLGILLLTQWFLGIFSVLWQLPVLLSVAHLATATALVGTLVAVNDELRSP